ncbi:MAG: tRNA guanosine(34) transglycosylase Tgt [Actinomycetota bacterium]|nr:tRNA guanosine(34) transglycosylase Tgt [Actinomycetota bacterium]
MTTLQLTIEATDGAARAGVVTTARGSFRTPCFMPVGTRGAVRAVSTADLEDLGAEVMLANTYHLMLRPGADVVAELGGVHGFASWHEHVLTDSGGFQVFSLDAEVDDDGVTFRSTYDGSTHRLTPERAVAVQELLGADIQVALDVCPPLPSPPEVLRLAVDRTAAWARRAREAHRRPDQALFCVVQGGLDAGLRAQSAGRHVEVGFDGYAVGGLSVGESRAEMLDALAATVAELPADQPRYLMGVGDPLGLVEAVALGMDMFDCVWPTRLARHGTVLTSEGRLHLRNAAYARDPGPLDPACPCPVCARWSRAYLRHLLMVGERGAGRLITLHNLAWTLAVVAAAREAVKAGRWAAVRQEVAATWAVRR